MCGRYALCSPVDDLQRRFGFADRPNLAPSYNVAPTQAALVVRRRTDGAGRELALLCCGWYRDIEPGLREPLAGDP